MNVKDLSFLTEANVLALILKTTHMLTRYSLIRSILPTICICFLLCTPESACIW